MKLALRIGYLFQQQAGVANLRGKFLGKAIQKGKGRCERASKIDS
jgi:hypothetical protein